MKKVFVGFVLMMVLAMSSISVSAQQSVAGAWIMSIQELSLHFVLVQDGEKISGTLESPHGEIRLTGEFSKGKLTMSGASAEPHSVQVAGTATLNADGSLAGNISVNSRTWNGDRHLRPPERSSGGRRCLSPFSAPAVSAWERIRRRERTA